MHFFYTLHCVFYQPNHLNSSVEGQGVAHEHRYDSPDKPIMRDELNDRVFYACVSGVTRDYYFLIRLTWAKIERDLVTLSRKVEKRKFLGTQWGDSCGRLKGFVL